MKVRGNDEPAVPELLDIHKSFFTKGAPKQLTSHLTTKFRLGDSAFLFSGNRNRCLQPYSYWLAHEASRERVASQWGLGNTPSSYPLVPIPTDSSFCLATCYPSFLFGWFFTLKMEVIRSSETSVHILNTERYIPEDGSSPKKISVLESVSL
jgi:hypothetical protein